MGYTSKYSGEQVEALLDKVTELDTQLGEHALQIGELGAQLGDINTILESIINE